jgi:hypothetical protein
MYRCSDVLIAVCRPPSAVGSIGNRQTAIRQTAGGQVGNLPRALTAWGQVDSMAQVIAMAPTRVILTYKDYEALPQDGRCYEIHEGELVVSAAPPPSTNW